MAAFELSPERVLELRRSLVEDGYCIIPGVWNPDMVAKVRHWSDELLDSPANEEWNQKWQGDVEFVQSPREAVKAGKELGPDGQARTGANHSVHPIIKDIFSHEVQRSVCDAIGLESLRSDEETIILLSKYPGAPPLYWHQDMMSWDHPQAATPWPTRVFLNYYTVDTNRENGCLRCIPGSHRKRHHLHDVLPDAHGQELADHEGGGPVFADVPDAIDIPLAAGDLIIGDARLLHAAWPNNTETRRTCVLAWHNVFSFPQPPSWWDGDIPEEVAGFDESIEQPQATRTPRRSAQEASAAASWRPKL